MFREALLKASAFTFPYVGLRRSASGDVRSTVGSFVVLDPSGWILTSAHIVDEIIAVQNGGGEPHTEIWATPSFATLKPRLDWAKVHRPSDLAVGRITPVDSATFTEVPVLRDTSAEPLDQGESVCRLGFPFYGVVARYVDQTGDFELDPAAFPVPRFALDGIISRFNRRTAPDGTPSVFIETSTPGLRGQSGGPLLDTSGRVVGIQSHTEHLDLGFDARYVGPDGTEVVERQFLNVGAATHVDEIRALLDAEGCPYRTG